MSVPTTPVLKITVKTGYHGTSDTVATTVVKAGFSASSDGYLGKGVYFFSGSEAYDSGIWWANKRAKERFLERPLALLKADIELGKCLDYSAEESQGYVQQFANALRARGKRDFNDADVIELWAKTLSADTVVAVHRYEPLFDGSHFKTVTLSYICVRNLSKILSLQRVFGWN